MTDAVATQAPAEGTEEALLDAASIRSRVEELSLKCRRAREEEEEEQTPTAAAEADAARRLTSVYEVADEAMDEWDRDSVCAAIPSSDLGDLDAYLEWLKTEATVAEEMNRKACDEIAVLEDTTAKDMIQLDVGIKVLESSLWKLDPKDLSNCEASPIFELPDSTDLCRNQSIVDRECKYEVLKLDQQIEKSKMDLKLLQNMERDDAIWHLESMLSALGAQILDFKDNCLRVSLKAPILTSDCVIYEHKLDCDIDSFVSDHELLIELDEGIMEPKKVQIFPNDVCVDILIEMLKSSREMISSPSLGMLIQQIKHHIIVNALRRSLLNDANNSRHSFEYFEKEETIIAHLVRGIDIFIKTPADWPLSSYGLKLISICNSGTHPTNIASSLFEKAKELANVLELQIRRHLVRFVDSVEEILVQELHSELHTSRSSGLGPCLVETLGSKPSS